MKVGDQDHEKEGITYDQVTESVEAAVDLNLLPKKFKKGQVLATLDTSQWEQELIHLEKAVLQKQDALQAAEENLDDTEYTLDLALLNAKISLKTAWDDLFRVEEAYYNYLEVEISELKLDMAKMEKEQALEDLENIADEFDKHLDHFYAKASREIAEVILDSPSRAKKLILALIDRMMITKVDYDEGYL